MLRLNLFFILVVVAINRSDAVCGVCNANGMACVSQNEFHACFNNTPYTSITYKCPNSTHMCTKFGFICADPSEFDIKPACGDTSLCGVCTGVPNGGFTCTSRTTFTMCTEETLSKQRGSCPKGYLCDPNNFSSPCVRSCFVDETAICDLGTAIDAPELPPTESTTESTAPVTGTGSEPITLTGTTSTELEPTTSTITSLPIVTLSPSDTICSQHNSSGRFPQMDESNCSSYVNCFWKSGTLQSNTLPCPAGRYFNRNSRTCEVVKPVWCL